MIQSGLSLDLMKFLKRFKLEVSEVLLAQQRIEMAFPPCLESLHLKNVYCEDIIVNALPLLSYLVSFTFLIEDSNYLISPLELPSSI